MLRQTRSPSEQIIFHHYHYRSFNIFSCSLISSVLFLASLASAPWKDPYYFFTFYLILLNARFPHHFVDSLSLFCAHLRGHYLLLGGDDEYNTRALLSSTIDHHTATRPYCTGVRKRYASCTCFVGLPVPLSSLKHYFDCFKKGQLQASWLQPRQHDFQLDALL